MNDPGELKLGYYRPFYYRAMGTENEARMARLLWRGLGLPHHNGRFSGVAVWWTKAGLLAARAIYFDPLAGKYVVKDLT